MNVVTVTFHSKTSFSLTELQYWCPWWLGKAGVEELNVHVQINHTPHHGLLLVFKNNCRTTFCMDTAFAQIMFKSNCLSFPCYKIQFDRGFNYQLSHLAIKSLT